MGGERIAVHLDAIAAKEFDRSFSPEDERFFGLLRIVSTQRRIRALLQENEDLRPGDWLELKIWDQPGNPPVWSLQLQNDRFIGNPDQGGDITRSNIAEIRRISIGDPTEPPPRFLGAAVAPSITLGVKLRQKYSLVALAPQISPTEANKYLPNRFIKKIGAFVTALDVGQASFNKISFKGLCLLIFDAGQPVWFHLHTLPQGFVYSPRGRETVIISHWDTDHYAYGRQNKAFHDLRWIAPAQTAVGPNAYRFAEILNRKGNLILISQGRTTLKNKGARIIKCNGSNINGSGIAFFLRSKGREILLTGDADYGVIPGILKMNLNGIQVPHHGGAVLGQTPSANSKGRAVISFGHPNRYGHPKTLTIQQLEQAGWQIATTGDYDGVPQGNRSI